MKVLVVTNMYPNPEQPAFGTFVQDQVESLRRAGIDVDVQFINGRKSKFNYLWGIFRFWWQLAQSRYDLVHAHYALTGVIARLQFLYPVVVTYHGGETKDHVPIWVSLVARRGPRIYDRIIVVNLHEKELLNNDTKVRVIPCGVDLVGFQPMAIAAARTSLGLPMAPQLVLWAGEHWKWEKHFELVTEAMQVLRQHLPDAELVVVSGQPHAIMPMYMNACDVLVLTSRSEGSPMVVKEAMACNLPIVSTDVGDVAEVIGQVEGCHLVSPDPDDVADRLLEVLQWRQRTGGRDRIGHLSSGAIARRVLAVYEELVRPNGKANE